MRAGGALACAAALALASPARATQLDDPFAGAAFNLTSEDRDLLGRAAQSVIMGERGIAGTRAIWFNPHTNAGGVVTLRRAIVDHAVPCRLIAYDLTVPPAIRTHTYLLKWCHSGDGAWVPAS